jgi:hypothetical protein
LCRHAISSTEENLSQKSREKDAATREVKLPRQEIRDGRKPIKIKFGRVLLIHFLEVVLVFKSSVVHSLVRSVESILRKKKTSQITKRQGSTSFVAPSTEQKLEGQ